MNTLSPARDGIKKAKHIMEKRRRARINASLAQLKCLLPGGRGRGGSCDIKMEKADILERAVEHLRCLTDLTDDCQASADSCDQHDTVRDEVLNSYDQGYKECLDDVDNYLVRMRIDDREMRAHVLGHIASRKARFKQTYTTTSRLRHQTKVRRCGALRRPGGGGWGQQKQDTAPLSPYQHTHSPADSTTPGEESRGLGGLLQNGCDGVIAVDSSNDKRKVSDSPTDIADEQRLCVASNKGTDLSGHCRCLAKSDSDVEGKHQNNYYKYGEDDSSNGTTTATNSRDINNLVANSMLAAHHVDQERGRRNIDDLFNNHCVAKTSQLVLITESSGSGDVNDVTEMGRKPCAESLLFPGSHHVSLVNPTPPTNLRLMSKEERDAVANAAAFEDTTRTWCRPSGSDTHTTQPQTRNMLCPSHVLPPQQLPVLIQTRLLSYTSRVPGTTRPAVPFTTVNNMTHARETLNTSERHSSHLTQTAATGNTNLSQISLASGVATISGKRSSNLLIRQLIQPLTAPPLSPSSSNSKSTKALAAAATCVGSVAVVVKREGDCCLATNDRQGEGDCCLATNDRQGEGDCCLATNARQGEGDCCLANNDRQGEGDCCLANNDRQGDDDRRRRGQGVSVAVGFCGHDVGTVAKQDVSVGFCGHDVETVAKQDVSVGFCGHDVETVAKQDVSVGFCGHDVGTVGKQDEDGTFCGQGKPAIEHGQDFGNIHQNLKDASHKVWRPW